MGSVRLSAASSVDLGNILLGSVPRSSCIVHTVAHLSVLLRIVFAR